MNVMIRAFKPRQHGGTQVNPCDGIRELHFTHSSFLPEKARILYRLVDIIILWSSEVVWLAGRKE